LSFRRLIRRHCGRVVAAILINLLCWHARAEVIRLPAVAPPEDRLPGRLVSHPDSSAEVLQSPANSDPAMDSAELPPGTRKGAFQKLVFSETWLASGASRGFGVNDLELRMVLGFPFPTRQSPLLITPGFAVYYLDGPRTPDLPPRICDAYTQFRWMHQFSPRWAIDAALTPGIFSDFQQGTDDGVRISGHGVAVWTCRPGLKILLGAAYLDREDLGLIPAGGIIWTPYEQLRYELIMPRPRIALRVSAAGDIEDWAYLAGELGGGTWAVRRLDGANDLFTYRDWRIVLGIERKSVYGLDARLELAYVFGREVQYRSSTPDFTPADTVMLRGGVTY